MFAHVNECRLQEWAEGSGRWIRRRVSRLGALLVVVSIPGTSALSLATPSAAAADVKPYVTWTITKI